MVNMIQSQIVYLYTNKHTYYVRCIIDCFVGILVFCRLRIWLAEQLSGFFCCRSVVQKYIVAKWLVNNTGVTLSAVNEFLSAEKPIKDC